MLRVRVDSRIRIPAKDLPEDARRRLEKSCEYANPDFSKKRALGYSMWGTPPVIKTWRFDGECLTFPRGAMARIREILKSAGVPYSVKDAREDGAPVMIPLCYSGHEPRAYQREAAEKIVEVEQGVVRAATGSGKTTTAIYAASLVGVNSLVVLPSVKLMGQTREVSASLLGLREDDVGVIQGPAKRLRAFTVATQQTLWSRSVDEDVRNHFGAVFVDEAHHSAAKTFQEVIDQFPCRYRVAFTADERRKDRKEFLVYDAFGGVLHEMTREACEGEGVVVDVEVRVVFSDFEHPAYRLDGDFNHLLDRMVADERRNDLIVEIMLGELRAGEQVIACTHRREHVREIDRSLVARGVRSGTMLGGQDAADAREFEETRSGLRDGSVRAGVGTYGALGEGIDLPAVAVGVAATPITSNKQKFNQYRGRLCRPSPGKKHGRLYVVFDRKVFDERAFANILAWNRSVKVRRGEEWVDARGASRRAIMSA